jgi:hypothetical protein
MVANLYNNWFYQDDVCPECALDMPDHWWPVGVWNGAAWVEIGPETVAAWRAQFAPDGSAGA